MGTICAQERTRSVNFYGLPKKPLHSVLDGTINLVLNSTIRNVNKRPSITVLFLIIQLCTTYQFHSFQALCVTFQPIHVQLFIRNQRTLENNDANVAAVRLTYSEKLMAGSAGMSLTKGTDQTNTVRSQSSLSRLGGMDTF